MSGQQRELTLRFLAEPTDVNYGGKVHGGVVMKWIDQAGYAAAVGWSGRYSVTVAVGGIRFVAPIRISDLVTVRTKLVYTGTSSMHFSVDVTRARPRHRGRRRDARAPVHALRDRVRGAGRRGGQADRGAGLDARERRRPPAGRVRHQGHGAEQGHRADHRTLPRRRRLTAGDRNEKAARRRAFLMVSAAVCRLGSVESRSDAFDPARLHELVAPVAATPGWTHHVLAAAGRVHELALAHVDADVVDPAAACRRTPGRPRPARRGR